AGPAGRRPARRQGDACELAAECHRGVGQSASRLPPRGLAGGRGPLGEGAAGRAAETDRRAPADADRRHEGGRADAPPRGVQAQLRPVRHPVVLPGDGDRVQDRLWSGERQLTKGSDTTSYTFPALLSQNPGPGRMGQSLRERVSGPVYHAAACGGGKLGSVALPSCSALSSPSSSAKSRIISPTTSSTAMARKISSRTSSGSTSSAVPSSRAF